MDKVELKRYGLEVILLVLERATLKIDKLRELGDISGTEILEDKVISTYNKIYQGLLAKKFKELSKEELGQVEDMITDIRDKNEITDDEIKLRLIKRDRFKKNSGATVVKKFFKYNLNRLFDKKEKIVEIYNKYNEEEKKLENLLKETIQEEEQFDIIYRLQPIREKVREVEGRYLDIEKDIKRVKEKLEMRWTYEIYGVISEEELLQSYKNIFKMED